VIEVPSFDDIFAVMSAASVGDRAARVVVPDDPPLDDAATKFAIALNILLDDLALSETDGQRELAERGRLASRFQILADVSRECSAATGDLDDLLAIVARRLGELVGDMCMIRPISEDGEWVLPSRAVYHRDADLLAATRAFISTIPQRVGEALLGRIAATGKSLLIAKTDAATFAVSSDPRYRQIIERLGITSLIGVPLLTGGKVIGVAALVRTSPDHPYTEDDLHFLQSIADHAALAFANARSYAAERAARAAAEKAQADLQVSEARYRLMFEKSPLPKWVYDLETLSFLAVNDAAVQHYGYAREEFLRMTIKDIRPAEDIPQLLKTIDHQKPVEGAQRWRHCKKDGSVITVELSAHDFTFDGKPARLVVANDITARERAEEMLRKSEVRFARLSESGLLGIIVFDFTGRILEANDTFLNMVGLTREHLQQRVVRVQDITPPEQRETTDANIERLRKDGTVGLFEKEYLRRDGSRVSILAGGAMLDSERIVSFILDISERKQLERVSRQAFELEIQNRRIQEANRLKSEFLANMSHELRTPLNAILGFGELLHDGVVPPGSPQHREFLGDIVKSGRHLLELINDVLDLAKVEAGKLDFRPEAIDLEIIIAEVISIVRAISVAKSIRIDASVGPEVKEGIFLDPARLKQVLYNFLSNALKFTPAGGRVTVRALPHGEQSLLLEVEDTGPGIAPEDIGLLFVEFQQLDAGKAKQHQGTGLGLALTRHLAEAQGGSVGARSTIGRGSVFHVILPRRSAAGPAQPQFEPRPGAPGAPSVLVVEDDARDQALLVEALSEVGYAVEAASTGAQALALCSARKFDALSLDLLLPDMSGQEVLKQLRAGGPNRDIPVVVVTLVAERGVMAGFAVQDFLPKPIESGALLSSLARAGIRPEQPGSVLVVDDDQGSLNLMIAALTQLGFPTVGAHDAEEALRTVESAHPAAIVLDLIMPGMNGFEFLDRLRASPATRDTPVLVWTVKDLSTEEQAWLSRSVLAIVRKGHGGIPALLEDLRRLLPA
jgi:PAS domain S-box-containing protein